MKGSCPRLDFKIVSFKTKCCDDRTLQNETIIQRPSSSKLRFACLLAQPTRPLPSRLSQNPCKCLFWVTPKKPTTTTTYLDLDEEASSDSNTAGDCRPGLIEPPGPCGHWGHQGFFESLSPWPHGATLGLWGFWAPRAPWRYLGSFKPVGA